MTAAMNFDPTLHAPAVSNGTANVGSANQTGKADVSTATGSGQAVTTTAPVLQSKASTAGKLQAFQGFLQKAGHIANVVLGDLVKYVIPVAQVAALIDPAVEPAVAAFTTSVQLVQSTVLSTQQRWSAAGSAANTQKLADVLTVVEQPIILLFAQAGLHVDTDYVVNLVNGVVAILNAQPAVSLATASATTGA